MSELVRHMPIMGPRGEFMPSPVRGVTMERVPFTMGTDNGGVKTTNVVFLTTTSEDTGFALSRDPRIARYGFATETEGGRLIDQAATQEMDGYKGVPAGMDPDVLLGRAGRGSDVVGYAPQHYGWIQGQFVVDNGRLIFSKQDATTFTEPDVPLLGLHAGSNRWSLRRVSLEEGKLTEPPLIANTVLGFNGPALVEDGNVGNIVDIGTNSRVVGDPRNLLRLASYGVDGRFHELIRRAQPQTPEQMGSILEGSETLICTKRLTYREAKELRGLILTDPLASMHLRLDPGYSHDDNERVAANLTIMGELPFNSIPMTVSGVDENGNLCALIIPGRGETGGAEIPQASVMAQQLGMKGAIFGAAGNDARLQGIKDNRRELYVKPGTSDGEPRRHGLELAIFDIAA